MDLTGLDYGFRLQLLLVYLAASVVWVRKAVWAARPGTQRLLLVLPVVVANAATPALFSGQTEVCTTAAAAFMFLWLTNFKVLGFAVNRGPLCMPAKPLQFAAIMLMPITPQYMVSGDGIARTPSAAKLSESGGTSWQLLGRFVAKTALLLVIVLALAAYEFPRLVSEILYSLGLYAFLGFIMDGPASLITWMIGLRISPHFDQPYFSPSMASFWGRRWNLAASNSLRFLIFDPIYEGRLVYDHKTSSKLSQGRRVLGLAAAFCTSGIIHECIYWHLQGYSTGLWMLFFSLQFPLLAVESTLQLLAKRHNVKVPTPVAIATSITVLIGMGDLFFFPPCTSTARHVHSLADRVIGSIKDTYDGYHATLR